MSGGVRRRRGKREPAGSLDAGAFANVPAQRIHLRIDSVAARLTSSHLRAVYVAAERLERDARRAPHAHLRPTLGPSSIVSDNPSNGGESARAWWRFAIAAVTLRIREEMERRGRSFRVDEVVRAMRARREYVESYVQNAIAPHPKPANNKKNARTNAAARWPPPMDVGSVPAMDAVEARYPVHVCVLFRAIAHQQARRRGLIRDVEEDDGVGRGRRRGVFPRLWFFGKKQTRRGREGARIVQLGTRRVVRRRGHERGRLGQTRRRVRRRGARRGGGGCTAGRGLDGAAVGGDNRGGIRLAQDCRRRSGNCDFRGRRGRRESREHEHARGSERLRHRARRRREVLRRRIELGRSMRASRDGSRRRRREDTSIGGREGEERVSGRLWTTLDNSDDWGGLCRGESSRGGALGMRIRGW